MTDVRLTALNPEDSQVYPVACNTSGELKLEKQSTFDGNLDGDLTVSGSASFSEDITVNGGATTTGTPGITLFNGGAIYASRASPDSVLTIRDSTSGSDTAILNADGSASFSGGLLTIDSAGAINTSSGLTAQNKSVYSDSAISVIRGYGKEGELTTNIFADGSGVFFGDVVIGSRSKQWMLVEQGGLCHMVEQGATTADVDPGFSLREYPKLRDVFQELNTIERCLEEVMTKLRMTEPDGWPVWDGSDNSR